jgi:hypothetical protein
MRRIRSVLIGILAVILLVTLGFAFWANMVMQGEREAAMQVWENDEVTVTSTDHSVVLSPSFDNWNGTGLVFIPGAKVDPYAYMYKLSGIVESGTTVVITKPTLNLAFFDTRPFSDFASDAPEVRQWYVGGHSLGGVKACMLAETDDRIVGLVLFGSYCANDLSSTDLTVVTISGQNDQLSTPLKVEDSLGNLPSDAEWFLVDGANHANFGDYGRQPGDGNSRVSSEEMRDILTRDIEQVIAP